MAFTRITAAEAAALVKNGRLRLSQPKSQKSLMPSMRQEDLSKSVSFPEQALDKAATECSLKSMPSNTGHPTPPTRLSASWSTKVRFHTTTSTSA